MGDDLPIWAAFAGLVPLLLGGAAAAMRLFIEPIKEFRDRATRIETRLLEETAVRLSTLLKHARNINRDSLLRGDGRNEPDLVDDYSVAVFRLHRMLYRLELLRLTIRWCFHALLGTMILGVAGMLIGFVSPPTRWSVIVATICIVVIQILCIVVNYASARQLEQYEDIA